MYYAPGVVENLLSLRRLRGAGGSMVFPSTSSGESPHLSLHDGLRVQCEERDDSTYLTLRSFTRALTSEESFAQHLQTTPDSSKSHILEGGQARSGRLHAHEPASRRNLAAAA